MRNLAMDCAVTGAMPLPGNSGRSGCALAKGAMRLLQILKAGAQRPDQRDDLFHNRRPGL
jgi:hypothetical protein